MAAERGFENNVDLVLEGGGVKGIGLAGAYAVLEERGFEPQNVAGTSAGAITAALIAARYGAEELRDIIVSLDFEQFQDRAWEDRIPVFDRTTSVLLDQGIYEGTRFYEWMKELLAAKGVHTFADLVDDEYGEDSKYRSRLQVIASDVTARRLLVLPRDARSIGFEPDELEVALAVRMSMSIPIFFEPVRVDGADERAHVIVDGGMLSNFPVWIFDCEPHESPEWPTFGLLLVEPSPKTPVAARLPEAEREWGVSPLLGYIKSMAQTMMEAHDRLYVEKAEYARTIPIPTLGVGTTEFDLSRERALELYDSGRNAAESFLETWDFDAYIAEFRRGKDHSRRREIVEQMRSAVST